MGVTATGVLHYLPIVVSMLDPTVAKDIELLRWLRTPLKESNVRGKVFAWTLPHVRLWLRLYDMVKVARWQCCTSGLRTTWME